MNGIIKPKALLPGDTIALIAPSEPVTKVQVAKVERFFVRAGYKVKTAPNILKRIGDYVAGAPAERAADFNWAFAEAEIKAVFTVVGGLGASQFLELVNFDNIKNNPKLFVGYSDATTLQLGMLTKTGLISLHGPNALSLPDFQPRGYTMNSFWRTITDSSVPMVVKPQSVWQEVRNGKTEGILFGGNLSCLCKLLGTPWDPLPMLREIFGKDARYLFFWEEDYEQFSEIMRNLWQLRNSGFFSLVSGMIVGKLTGVKEVDYENFPSKKELLREITAPFNFPILYGVDFGHEVPKATIPIGVRAQMETSAPKLEILEPVVV